MDFWNSVKQVGRYLPFSSNVEAGLQGDWKGAIDPFQPIENAYDDAKGGAINAFHAYTDARGAPYEEKKRGLQEIADMAGQIKAQRQQRQQDTLAASRAALDPARKAINAVYGDPTTWKL